MNTRYYPAIRRQCITALGAVVNLVCSFLAGSLHLPIYMDSIGTIMVTSLLGPKYGIASGLLGCLLSGITYDVYSFYFAPVQITTAIMAGLIMKSKWGKGWRMIPGGIAVSLPTALISACIAAYVFGGQTSAGSSYLVMLLDKLGMSLALSCFVVQIFTEYLDKLMAMILTRVVLEKGGIRAKWSATVG